MFEVGTKVRLKSWVTVGILVGFGVPYSESKYIVEDNVVGVVVPTDSNRPVSAVEFSSFRWIFKDEWLVVVEEGSPFVSLKDVLESDMSDSDKVLAIRNLVGW